MISSLSQTPNAMRVHIAVFGRRNNGKSSLINAFTGQHTALVSDVAGTTTDPVYKPMEIYPIGPCVIIDTAGFDDEGKLGEMRVEKTAQVLDLADIAIMVFSPENSDYEFEKKWIDKLREKNCPIIGVINFADVYDNTEEVSKEIAGKFGIKTCTVSAKEGKGTDKLIKLLAETAPDTAEISLTGHLCDAGDSVLLVMPQDIQAPKGRLILPQVQVIRDLLDRGVIITSVTADNLETGLGGLKKPPKLIITDSQVFDYVYERKPAESQLTSFSMLMARYKGDIDVFRAGAEKIDFLKETDTVLIAEACSHAPQEEDIGRVKIPKMLKKKIGDGLKFEFVAGKDFPEDLSRYALVIHCGGCMFNRKYILSRVKACKKAGVPITNYGIVIAKIKGILDKIKD